MNVFYTTVKGRRNENEDKHNIIINMNEKNKKNASINLFAVYDGHGGEYVSNELQKIIPQTYLKKDLSYPITANQHKQIFEQIQKKLLANNKANVCGSTCLINLMYRYENLIHMNFINIGDSRATIVYKNGLSRQVTIDHKPDDVVEKKRISGLGGEIMEDSEGVFRVGDLSLARSFGDGDHAPFVCQTPDVFYKKVTPETKYVVMACDGLWDVIANNELFNLFDKFKKNNANANLAEEIANECLKRGTTDNVSVIIIEFE
jgi:serine/threonine protein phosphatase PrpC